MPYRNLKKLGFCKPTLISLEKEINQNFVLSVPCKSGVYIVMIQNNIKRLRGESNILYIGRSRNLQRRMKYLLKYFLPSDFVGNWGRHTARNAIKVIIEETDYKPEITYCVFDNYKEMESRLLQAYCKNHIEGPPLNNQRK
jgi:hypothetical protein